MGEPEQDWLLTSDAGYGFVVKLSDLYSKNRAGKVVLKLSPGAHILPPQSIQEYAKQS